MNVYEIVYIMALLATIGFFIAKFYNVTRRGTLYSFWTALLIFGGNLLAWLFMLVVFINNPETNLYNTTFSLVSINLTLQVLFIIIELFFGLSSTATSIEAYKPLR